VYSTLQTKVTRCWSLSQPNKYAFNALRNCWRVRSDCRRLDGRLFHSYGPATRSPCLMSVVVWSRRPLWKFSYVLYSSRKFSGCA